MANGLSSGNNYFRRIVPLMANARPNPAVNRTRRFMSSTWRCRGGAPVTLYVRPHAADPSRCNNMVSGACNRERRLVPDDRLEPISLVYRPFIAPLLIALPLGVAAFRSPRLIQPWWSLAIGASLVLVYTLISRPHILAYGQRCVVRWPVDSNFSGYLGYQFRCPCGVARRVLGDLSDSFKTCGLTRRSSGRAGSGFPPGRALVRRAAQLDR